MTTEGCSRIGEITLADQFRTYGLPPAHTKTPRAKTSPAAWDQSGVRNNNPDLWGAGERPVGMKEVGWRDHPRPTGEGCPRLPGARPALLQAKPDASPGRSRRVRPFGERTRPLPPAPDGAYRQARQGRARPASGMTPHRLGARPALTAMRIGRRRLHTLKRDTTGSGHSRERPSPHPPRWDRPPRWPGTDFASFRPAVTVPACQNSPPPASQDPVSPGHPCVTEGSASIARGQMVGKILGEIF